MDDRSFHQCSTPDCPGPVPASLSGSRHRSRGSSRQSKVLVVGAGNIGSPLAPLVSRPGVGLIRIVDRDRVEPRNLTSQDYRAEDVGRSKAQVLAERVRNSCPGVKVEAYAADLEDLPWGLFDVDVLLGALDSRRARQLLISEIAWPQGIPVVDGGVGLGLLGRVQVFHPGPKSGCFECNLGKDDYRHLAAEYPCTPGGSIAAPPTNAPAFLGAVVAGTMAAECARILAGRGFTESREIVIDLDHGRTLLSRLGQSAHCRFDHEVVSELINLDPPFNRATGRDLISAVNRRFDGASVHLECRRGVHWGDTASEWSSRFLDLNSLRTRSEMRLSELGLDAEDRIRVRSASSSAFVVLSRSGNVEPSS
jgi:molybdopterin/thiamine biosynthesis adenylyltransferase